MYFWGRSRGQRWEFQFSRSVVSNAVTPRIAACQASLSITNSWSSPKLMCRVSDAIQPSLSSPSPPAPNPSQHQGLFQWINSLHEVAKGLEFQPQHQFLQWTGLISFTMNWLQSFRMNLLAVQRTLKSLLQHHSSKASFLRRSAFFTVQLSHPYITTGKTIALTRWAFVGKVISLLFNMLSRLVITLLPRSKHLLMASRFSILALRTLWTVWKGKMIGYWKRNSPSH